MKIELIQDEIVEGIALFITSQGINVTTDQIAVDLTAGRGGNGHTASVEIIPASQRTETPCVETEELKEVSDSSDVDTEEDAEEEAPVVEQTTPLFATKHEPQ